jgi:hypothetical protein
MLYIFGGLPAAGKSTIASRLAGERRAVYLRIDTIENALRSAGLEVLGPEGYCVAYAVAEDNLRAGLSVVADSVNPLNVTREAWREVAKRGLSPFVEIEVVCSDLIEHRIRVETRPTDIPGHTHPTWQEVIGHMYEKWTSSRIVIDTAGKPIESAMEDLRRALLPQSAGSL